MKHAELLSLKTDSEILGIISGITDWCIGDPNDCYFEDVGDAINFAEIMQFIVTRGKTGWVPDADCSSLGKEIERLILA